MFSFFDKVTGVKIFLGILTWKKIAQVAVFLLILLSAWAAFESRESIYNFIKSYKLSSNLPTLTISKTTSSEIETTVNKSDLIVAIQITVVNFQKNERNIIYTYIDDTELRTIYENYQRNNIFDLPLFTNAETNNKILVDLINGEYVCTIFKDTITYKLIPMAENHIKTICSSGIPPFYGKFSGIVSVFTKRIPTIEEIDQLRGLTKNISAIVYERDFK
jgi:hypothetical protein